MGISRSAHGALIAALVRCGFALTGFPAYGSLIRMLETQYANLAARRIAGIRRIEGAKDREGSRLRRREGLQDRGSKDRSFEGSQELGGTKDRGFEGAEDLRRIARLEILYPAPC